MKQTKTGPRPPDPSAGDPAPERGAETRAALLAAGRRVFARRGFEGASVREITREAGANLGAITYHFGSKRALYVEILVRGLSPAVDRVGEAAAGPGTPLDRLSRVVEVFFDHLAANPDLPRLMLQQLSAGKAPPPEMVALIRRNLRYIGGIVAEGWKDGSIRPGHPVLMALSVVSQPIYMTVMAPMLREVGGVDLSDPQVRAAAAEHVKAFMRGGLAPAPETR